MTIRLNPAVRKLWRSPNEIQFGYPARLQLSDLDEQAEALISAIGFGVAERQTSAQALALGVSEAQLKAMIERLQPILMRADQPTQTEVDSRFTELMRIALVSDDPHALAIRRSQQRIFVNRLSRFGMTTLRGLAASGFKRMLTTDAKHVQPSDTLTLGLRGGPGLGQSRYAAASAEFGPILQLHHYLREETVRTTDFAILQADEVVEPKLYQRWLSNDVPHLAVSFDEAGVSVSPVIIPGVTSCLACLAQREIASDPEWGALATQMSLNPRDLADSASLLFAAGLATHRAQSFLDTKGSLRAPGELRGVRLNNSGVIERVDYAPTSCGCR
jgi:hypothetical protein